MKSFEILGILLRKATAVERQLARIQLSAWQLQILLGFYNEKRISSDRLGLPGTSWDLLGPVKRSY